MKKGDKVRVNQCGEVYEATILEVYPTWVSLDWNGIYQEAKKEEIQHILPSGKIEVTYNGYNWSVTTGNERLDEELFRDEKTGTKAEMMTQARHAKHQLGNSWKIEAETLSRKDRSDNMKMIWKQSKKSGFNNLWRA